MLIYEPRDYQAKAFDDVLNAFFEFDRVILQSPTRSGKGLVIAMFVEYALKHNRSVLILVDYGILFNGIKKELDKHGIEYGTIKQNYEPKQITIASKDTYINREPIMFDLCIVDEAHKSLSDSFQEAITAKKVLGVTATPDNMSWYQKIIKTISIKELQARKVCADVEILAPNEPDFSGVVITNGDFSGEAIVKEIEKQAIVGEAVEHYKKHTPDKKGMVYCSTIAHAEKVAADFCQAGISAVSITSKDNDRDKKIDDYYKGKYKLLVSVNMFIAGFEIAECEVIIWLRPTQSIIVWMQGNGRGMIYTGSPLIVLDPVGNVHRMGLINVDREWRLGKRIKPKVAEVMIRTCQECYKAFEPHYKSCPYCNSKTATKSRAELKKIAGELKKIEAITKKERHKKWKSGAWRCETLDELRGFAVECGYDDRYAFMWWSKVLRRR